MIAVADDFYPLVLLDMGDAERTPDEVRRMFASFREVNQRALKEKSRYVLVAVTYAPPAAAERRIIIDEANRFSPNDFKLVSSCVLVLQNSMVRGVVTALGWMIPHIPKLEAASTTAVAVQLAVEHLRKRGIAHPADLAERANRWFRQREPARGVPRAGKASA